MKIFKKIAIAVLLSVGLAATASAQAQQKVAITMIVEHPALEEIRQGIVDQLAKEGFVDGQSINIDYQNAQGSTATAGQIARKFVGDKADVIIPITTPSAQPVAAATRNIPIVFSAITDPIAARLVKDWGKNEGNVVGISDQAPLEPQVELIQTLVPQVKTIGYIYSPGEVNSVVILDMLKQAAEAKHLKVLAVPAQRTVDISTAAASLVGKVEAIYTSTDNNVVSAYEALYRVAVANKIPLIAADFGSVKRGAIAAMAVNQYQIGVETGKMAAEVLRGTPVTELATVKMQNLDVYVNPEAAKLQGVEIPETLKAKATVITKE